MVFFIFFPIFRIWIRFIHKGCRQSRTPGGSGGSDYRKKECDQEKYLSFFCNCMDRVVGIHHTVPGPGMVKTFHNLTDNFLPGFGREVIQKRDRGTCLHIFNTIFRTAKIAGIVNRFYVKNKKPCVLKRQCSSSLLTGLFGLLPWFWIFAHSGLASISLTLSLSPISSINSR